MVIYNSDKAFVAETEREDILQNYSVNRVGQSGQALRFHWMANNILMNSQSQLFLSPDFLLPNSKLLLRPSLRMLQTATKLGPLRGETFALSQGTSLIFFTALH